MRLTVLDPNNPEQDFPRSTEALEIPDGLLAVGGCLSKSRLLRAYRHGIFPWNGPDEPILWWSPNPRLVLLPERLVVSHSLAKTMRKKHMLVTFDRAFAQVIDACGQNRKQDSGTWITPQIKAAYQELHDSGYAHSVEAWFEGELVGGLYGIAIGQVFFGESMFYRKTDASKVAFASLVRELMGWGYRLIDCQVSTGHLKTLGAETVSRDEFNRLLTIYCEQTPASCAWQVK
jgi:leucyl/phenylalanyl-tRNA---protein transferase